MPRGMQSGVPMSGDLDAIMAATDRRACRETDFASLSMAAAVRDSTTACGDAIGLIRGAVLAASAAADLAAWDALNDFESFIPDAPPVIYLRTRAQLNLGASRSAPGSQPP